MNETKLREMMKIYTVSKQVNKRAEKNFIKFSSQYFKMHKSEMTPEFLNEINQLRTKIKEEKASSTKHTSPVYSPRMTNNSGGRLFNQSSEKARFDSAHSGRNEHMDIFKLYNEEITDLKQQLNQANQRAEVNRRKYENNLKELNDKLYEQMRINALLNRKIQDMQVKYEGKILKSERSEISSLSLFNQDEKLNKEQSRELFKSEIQRALEKYSNKNELKQI